MSITVADEGNKRMGGMGREETEQCVLDILSFFQRNGIDKSKLDKATNADIQRLEKSIGMQIPYALNVLLMEANGGIYYMEREFMSCDKITETIDTLRNHALWRTNIIPICGDESSLLAIDTEEQGGPVYEWDEDDGCSKEPLFPTTSSFFEGYRNLLLGGSCEYLKDLGVVEKMTAKRK
jgi:hypothetical protein